MDTKYILTTHHTISFQMPYIWSRGQFYTTDTYYSRTEENRLSWRCCCPAHRYSGGMWNMEAWAILHNHYHFIARSPASATTLPKLIRQLHSITAIELNKWDRTPGRQVWFNYWDTCITYERSYLARLHYVLMNPVKHGLVESPIDYPYCSYKWFVKQSDQDLQSLVFDQPIDKVNIFDEF